MRKKIQGVLIGFLIGIIVAGSISIAANTTTLYDVITSGVKIIVDGIKLNPTDAKGNKVEPIIYNGTTYLPVRAVADALGKSVYWDGPNFTVYLGNMGGALEYPSLELTSEQNIGYGWRNTSGNGLKDNLGNLYTHAIYPTSNNKVYEIICNMKYSKLKGTIYVKEGTTSDYSGRIKIIADGKTIYTSPEITKTTPPIPINVNITGCYDLQIVNESSDWIRIGNAGLYQ